MKKADNDFPIRLNNPRVWRTYTGGQLLDRLHGSEEGTVSQFPEEWIMSSVTARNAGRESVENEGLSLLYDDPGVSLNSILSEDPAFYLGEKHAALNGAALGTLVKLIDSAERLTIQVHPDHESAMTLFNSPYGKTECWYILGGTEIGGEKPCIYFGFRPGITREHWEKLFAEQDIQGMLDAMYRFDVKVGDTILIEGGIPHAIGSGCFLVEIQEPTDYTVRVERVTPAGLPVADFLCHQGLGFEHMFDVFHYTAYSEEELRSRWFISPRIRMSGTSGSITTLIGYDTTPLFRLDEILVSGTVVVPDYGSFSGLYVLEGAGTLTANGKSVSLEKTAQFFVPYRTGEMTVSASPESPLRILHFFGPKG